MTVPAGCVVPGTVRANPPGRPTDYALIPLLPSSPPVPLIGNEDPLSCHLAEGVSSLEKMWEIDEGVVAWVSRGQAGGLWMGVMG